jgi:hypothetical protein
MLLLAGCAGGVDSGTTGPSGETTAAESGSTSGSTGTVNMYVSDERNAIDQFEHLNVTITKVGFQKADADGEDDEESESESEADSENESEIEADDDVEIETNATVNGSVDANTTGVNATADAEANASGEFDESDGWEEYEVDSKTVDLTKLQGANASALSSIDVEEGNYSKVFVYVSDINGTLENGEQVNVKLPSQKLQLNKGFTIGANESVDFVYDITVFEAGNSGKYILKPVASESGTSDEVEISVVDDEDERDDDAEDAGDDADDAAEDARDAADEAANGLNASFVSDVTAGSNATISVTQNGSAVADATVEVDGEVVGETDENGELTFSVPEGSEEVDVTVTSGDSEVELEQTLTVTADGGANAENGDDSNGLTPLFG